MATRMVRWPAALHLLTMLRDARSPALEGVAIESGWPGDRLAPECIWLDTLDGPIEIANLKGGRKERDDTFKIPLQLRVTGFTSMDATNERLHEIGAAVDDELANDTQLDELDGIVEATVEEAQFSTGRTADLAGGGIVGYGQFVVAVFARLE